MYDDVVVEYKFKKKLEVRRRVESTMYSYNVRTITDFLWSRHPFLYSGWNHKRIDSSTLRVIDVSAPFTHAPKHKRYAIAIPRAMQLVMQLVLLLVLLLVRMDSVYGAFQLFCSASYVQQCFLTRQRARFKAYDYFVCVPKGFIWINPRFFWGKQLILHLRPHQNDWNMYES